MEFARLLELVGDEPVFESTLLLAGDVDPNHVRRQLSRWVRAGRVYQLRRGLYALAPPFQKTRPHPFLVANRLRPGSYVSLQSALAFYGMIPEHVARVTSVTAARPAHWRTPLGEYVFRHVKPDLLFGYRLLEVTESQQAFVARPEKTLLDLVHLHPGGDALAYLQSLRLQNLEQLDPNEMKRLVERAHSPKLRRAAEVLLSLRGEEMEAYETL